MLRSLTKAIKHLATVYPALLVDSTFPPLISTIKLETAQDLRDSIILARTRDRGRLLLKSHTAEPLPSLPVLISTRSNLKTRKLTADLPLASYLLM